MQKMESSLEVKKLEEFTFSREKLNGNKPGRIYKNASGNEWLVKYPGNLASVHEAFCSALYMCFAGETHIPEGALFEGVHPRTGIRQYMVGSKIRLGYTEITELTELLDKNKVQGLELVTIVSALLREKDFVGNGNLGFDLALRQQLGQLIAMRIDFDDSLKDISVFADISKYNFVSDFFNNLGAKAFLQYQLFDRTKAHDAISRIASIDDHVIDQIYNQFKPFYEISIKRKIEELTQNTENEIAKLTENQEKLVRDLSNELAELKESLATLSADDPKNERHLIIADIEDCQGELQDALRKLKSLSFAKIYRDNLQSNINELSLYLVRLEQQLEQLKTNKATLGRRLYEFHRAEPVPQQFFTPKTSELLSPSETKKIEAFYELYDEFNVSLYDNFSKVSAKNLIKAMESQGTNSNEYLEYQKMKSTLKESFRNAENQLQFLISTAKGFSNNENNPVFIQIYEGFLRSIANQEKICKQNAQLEKVISEADEALAEIIPTPHYMPAPGT